MINIRALEGMGNVAVRCMSEDEAKEFMNEMWRVYPDKVEYIWNPGQTNWRGRSICYLPRIDATDRGASYCQSSSYEWCLKHGYEIIDFSDLETPFDLGDIKDYEVDLFRLLL